MCGNLRSLRLLVISGTGILALVAFPGIAGAQSQCGEGECLTCEERPGQHKAPCEEMIDWGVAGDKHDGWLWGGCTDGSGPHNHFQLWCGEGEAAELALLVKHTRSPGDGVALEEAFRRLSHRINLSPSRSAVQVWDCGKTKVLIQLPSASVPLGLEGR